MIVWEQWWVYTAHSLYQLYKIIKLPKFIVIVLFNKSALMKTVNSTCSAKYSRCVDFANDFYEKTMKQIWNSLYYYFRLRLESIKLEKHDILSMDAWLHHIFKTHA